MPEGAVAGRTSVSCESFGGDNGFLEKGIHWSQKAPFRAASAAAAKARAAPARSKSAPAKSTPSRIRAKPAGAPTPDAPQRCRRRLCDDEDSADDGAERVDAVAVHTGLLFISRFRELRGAKGSKLSPELRFALAFVAPKVQVGIGASPVPARVLSRTLYTKVQGYH